MKLAFLGSSLISPSVLDALTDGHVYTWDPCGGAAVWADYAAVFVFARRAEEISPETVRGFIGHPHLRVIAGETMEEQRAALLREQKALASGEECERKFLVTYPALARLGASPFAARSHIVQTYLTSDEGTAERVRMRDYGGAVVYTHTLKRRIDRQTSEEWEREITEEEYRALLQRVDPERTPIEKTRWCILYAGQYFELDVYPFWSDRATVELEAAERSDAPIDFPPYFRVIREVTEDVRYKNARLAREVPYDEIG